MTPGVFQPYPESEGLIDVALTHLPYLLAPLRILDLGTGSGCLLLALLKAYPNASGLGVDCDDGSIAAARENASALSLDSRARFQSGDWVKNIEAQFDLIVSNPPRVPSALSEGLLPEMLNFDPRTAYDGGADGLLHYEEIIRGVDRISNPETLLVLHVSDAVAVTKILARAGYPNVFSHRNFVGETMALAVVLRKQM